MAAPISEVYLYIHQHRGAGVREVAQALGMRVRVARHHVENLRGNGFVRSVTKGSGRYEVDPGKPRPTRPAKRATRVSLALVVETALARQDDTTRGLSDRLDIPLTTVRSAVARLHAAKLAWPRGKRGQAIIWGYGDA